MFNLNRVEMEKKFQTIKISDIKPNKFQIIAYRISDSVQDQLIKDLNLHC